MKTISFLFLSLFVLAGCAPRVDDPDGQNGAASSVPTATVQYTWTGTVIRADGSVLLQADELPDSIEVSADSAFGASGEFTSFAVSPQGDWLAFATTSGVHEAGWIYNVQTEKYRPVVFQYGGGVEVVEWQDNTHIVFSVTTPQPATETVVIDINDLPDYPRLGTGATVGGEWETYQNTDLGVRLEYPSDMTIEEQANDPADESVRFSLWGPTQQPDTEIFDGISVTLRRDTFSGGLQAFVEAQAQETTTLGTIVDPVEQTTFAGETAYTYTADTLGVHTHYFVQIAPGTPPGRFAQSNGCPHPLLCANRPGGVPGICFFESGSDE